MSFLKGSLAKRDGLWHSSFHVYLIGFIWSMYTLQLCADSRRVSGRCADLAVSQTWRMTAVRSGSTRQRQKRQTWFEPTDEEWWYDGCDVSHKHKGPEQLLFMIKNLFFFFSLTNCCDSYGREQSGNYDSDYLFWLICTKESDECKKNNNDLNKYER